ncbi:hypothetical protein PRIPAC_95730 [Pristionchus pacificus]|uniref:Uncharacterized protein n=1 Tax=Pristionchus pacificus TaxID=54126 RepID=A0A2A6BJU6_PRIPA|nr:hypothetical protein PRIPAC_95730 [Pristionchus pacificus]|eukprot:PDM66195.1 hypothetical protein PRIPAC_45420 [Pristionchus pacificus]
MTTRLFYYTAKPEYGLVPESCLNPADHNRKTAGDVYRFEQDTKNGKKEYRAMLLVKGTKKALKPLFDLLVGTDDVLGVVCPSELIGPDGKRLPKLPPKYEPPRKIAIPVKPSEKARLKDGKATTSAKKCIDPSPRTVGTRRSQRIAGFQENAAKNEYGAVPSRNGKRQRVEEDEENEPARQKAKKEITGRKDDEAEEEKEEEEEQKIDKEDRTPSNEGEENQNDGETEGEEAMKSLIPDDDPPMEDRDEERESVGGSSIEAPEETTMNPTDEEKEEEANAVQGAALETVEVEEIKKKYEELRKKVEEMEKREQESKKEEQMKKRENELMKEELEELRKTVEESKRPAVITIDDDAVEIKQERDAAEGGEPMDNQQKILEMMTLLYKDVQEMKERERKKAEVEAQKARVPPPPRRDEPAIKNEATDVPVDDRSMEEREEAVHAGDSQAGSPPEINASADNSTRDEREANDESELNQQFQDQFVHEQFWPMEQQHPQDHEDAEGTKLCHIGSSLMLENESTLDVANVEDHIIYFGSEGADCEQACLIGERKGLESLAAFQFVEILNGSGEMNKPPSNVFALSCVYQKPGQTGFLPPMAKVSEEAQNWPQFRRTDEYGNHCGESFAVLIRRIKTTDEDLDYIEVSIIRGSPDSFTVIEEFKRTQFLYHKDVKNMRDNMIELNAIQVFSHGTPTQR